MYLRSDDRRPQIRNGLALRIAVVGGLALALFAMLFFRLWDLQVLSGPKYLAEANNNRTREFRVIAPRGYILDRNGKVLVDNRTSLALQVNPQKLPSLPSRRQAELARLGALAHMSPRQVRRTMHEQLKVAAGAPVTLRRDVGYDLVYYLQENQDRFPGVQAQRVFVRHYPGGSLAAHVLGSVGEVSEEQLKEARYRNLQPGDQVGQGGVEHTYDRFLRGQPGLTRIQVNALGQPTPGGQLVSKPPVPGNSLKLSIDSSVQAAGEQALAARGLPGAFVTMDVSNGQILGLGSFPTFDPSEFTKPLTQAQVNSIYHNPLSPLTNRATEGLYPTGSTFKLITAMAALSSGVITPETTIVDGGSLTIGGQTFKNSGGASYGTLSLVPALQVSSDVFFYTLGLRMWNTGALQHWAHMLGIGRPTGIDLPEQAVGLLPSRQWRDRLYRRGETERPWSAGDNVQLATGQGDLQTNPLQMAIAYATVANGGTVVTPHVGMEVDDAAGRVLKEFEPPPRRHVHVDPTYRAAILKGLHEAAQTPGGTSYAVFGGFPVPVAGKTGTAQRPPNPDQSWYIVLAPYPNPRIVTAVTIEQGGFGVESAAPAALKILEAYFNKHTTGTAGPNGGSPG
ncbi:MAG TPA: penicillin-binding protein 2 [Solirubrobacterales bacterium]|jgi:penicillin-binding protein 2|nr:penicillin-binding protein 2 [Solirubrobacterales bacterium]